MTVVSFECGTPAIEVGIVFNFAVVFSWTCFLFLCFVSVIEAVLLIRKGFNAGRYPAIYVIADPDPGATKKMRIHADQVTNPGQT
jgi:hypothetical protein